MAEYDISRADGRCSVSGHTFEEGEEFYTAVIDGSEGLERHDFACEAWQGPPEGTLCHFKTRLPKRDEPKKTFVDDEILINFFQRLADSTDELKLRFRFVLSLILMRKRLVKYERTERDGDREIWQIRLMRDKSLHKVTNPALDDAQIEEVSGELNAILHGQVVSNEDADAEDEETQADPATAAVDSTPEGDDPS